MHRAKPGTYNPWASSQHDTEREIKKLWEKRPLTPEDVAKLEKLEIKMEFFRGMAAYLGAAK